MKKQLLNILLLVFIAFANAQETAHEEGEEHKEKRHSIAVLISHTQISEAVEAKEKKASRYPLGVLIITSKSPNVGQ